MARLDKKELIALEKEIKAEIRDIKQEIKKEEKRDEFSRKVDRLYDNLEGNELLLDAVSMTISDIRDSRNKLSDEQWEEIVKEFGDAVEFADRNGASWSKNTVLNRVVVSDKNENKMLEDRQPSLSGLTKKAVAMLSSMEQTEPVIKAIALIKKVPSAYRKDLENGTDKANDYAGDAVDILFNAKRRGELEGIEGVMEVLDDMMFML